MRTVLWDLDGTVADTEKLHFQAWQTTLSGYGVTYTYERFLSEFGRRNGDFLPALLQVEPESNLVVEVARAKEANFRQLVRSHGLRPLRGVTAWLQRFHEAGVYQAISSSAPMANIAVMVDTLDIGDHFLALLAGAELPRSKPDPAIFLNSAAALGVAPQECLVVEDSIHGIVAARRAGMGSVAVGKLSGDPELAALRQEPEEPACAALASLEDLTWQTCNRLWESARR
ncbi:MAG: HAD family phosphatase [Chloroflexota bacterium]|nr:HAD family phosphatase [Chloroflexota bacterium]